MFFLNYFYFFIFLKFQNLKKYETLKKIVTLYMNSKIIQYILEDKKEAELSTFILDIIRDKPPELLQKYCTDMRYYQKKVAYLFDGPIYYWGMTLTNHYQVSEKIKGLLLDIYGFDEVHLVRTQTKNQLKQLFQELQQPGVLGVLMYCGHGNQYGSSSEKDGTAENWFGISDVELSQYINTLHTHSLLVMIFDACFSDGFINTDSIKADKNYIYFSAAREKGPDETRSALYTGDGGWLTYNVYDYLHKLNRNMSYQDLLDALVSDTKRYYSDPDNNNLHWPRIITSSTKLLGNKFLNYKL